MSRAARSAGVALLVALSAGCGIDPSPSGVGWSAASPADSREWEVAADPDATPAEIVDAGVPRDVAVSGDRRVITWEARPEDDEGSAAGAWRLYDADGERVADGRFDQVQEQQAVIDVRVVPDGFLLLDYATGRWQHLDADGTVEVAPAVDDRRPVEAGDVLLEPTAEQVWSVTDHVVHRLPRPPTSAPQGTAVAPDGTVTVLLPRRPGGDAVVASSTGGSGPWSRTRLDLAPGAVPGALLTAADGSLVLTSVQADADVAGIDALFRRAADDTWSRSVAPSGVGLAEPRVDVLDGRLLLSESPRIALQDAAADRWAMLEPPGLDTSVVVAGARLWNLDTRGHVLRTSDDLGATWQEVAR